MKVDWAYIDRLGERIIELLNAELAAAPDGDRRPIETIAAQMMAMLSFLETARDLDMPEPLLAVREAMLACLRSIHAASGVIDA
jgi:hypothetical protein